MPDLVYLATALAVAVAITVALRAVPFAVKHTLGCSALLTDIGRWMPLVEHGGRLRRSNSRRTPHWSKTVASVGLSPDFHFHDPKHTGNQLAAKAGTTTMEFVRRMGHSTVRAAMRYQHSTDRRASETHAPGSKE